MTYRYAIVVTGQLEARDEGHARLQVEMGFALLGRLLKSPNGVQITILPERLQNNLISGLEGADGQFKG